MQVNFGAHRLVVVLHDWPCVPVPAATQSAIVLPPASWLSMHLEPVGQPVLVNGSQFGVQNVTLGMPLSV